MTAQQSAWTESDSQKFLSFSEMITPSRAEQMVMLANLVPAASADAFAMAEIGCGGGASAAACRWQSFASRIPLSGPAGCRARCGASSPRW